MTFGSGSKQIDVNGPLPQARDAATPTTASDYYHVGVDIGSTTVKIAVFDPQYSTLLHKEYTKHLSDIKTAVVNLFHGARGVLTGRRATILFAGSGAVGVSKALGLSFIQEVIACTEAVERYAPQTDVAIELGGEDAKITYFGKLPEQRMNGTCAGGTGSFIDQMAALLQTDAAGLNELARAHQRIYPIASRCGVFAKTDMQPLLNEGAAREDIAASVLQAVVNQTIGGLACGKPIRGKVAFLGGPLFFLSELRARFIETLHLDAARGEVVFPPDSHYFVAIGAALASHEEAAYPWEEIIARLPGMAKRLESTPTHLPPMFASEDEYRAFCARHDQHQVEKRPLEEHTGDCYLGIDAGSTTTKLALVDGSGRLLYSHYGSNQANPLRSTTDALGALYEKLPPGARIAYSCVTGYGEGLIRAALRVDEGEIETMAHYRAADFFLPGVDFLLDIGGQDMKCLMIRRGVIEGIILNEACSSGCGSFIETFAHSLGHSVEDFAQLGVRSQAPVDLGTRCTVFMNSRVKQVQKEGASKSDLSGGIAISVIKNALFKVIRLRHPDQLGERIVVQGGTFANPAVLRAFEQITGRDVVRPDITGIMGAFGAALLALERHESQETTLLSADAIRSFTYQTVSRRCGLCSNNCLLTVSTFPDGSSHVSGNRCDRGAGIERASAELPNLFAWKYRRLFQHYKPLARSAAPRGTIGIPRVLNMYEDYPFWFTLFTTLGFHVRVSPPSSKGVFEAGMETIPSDTICYPAKLVHGHIARLAQQGVAAVFYPSIPYNTPEDKRAPNHYNCPVVATYPEVIDANMDLPEGTALWHPFISIDHRERLVKQLKKFLLPRVPGLRAAEIAPAVRAAYGELESYRAEVRQQGEAALRVIEERGLHGIVLAGRPYHVDPEIHHGIPELLVSFGYPVLSEDSVAHLGRPLLQRPLRVVDQWVFHSRMYAAAAFVAGGPAAARLDLIQLVSFGCGLDAVTTDQVKELCEARGKMYTQIKIDEITNLGAARIRIRSLIASIRERAGLLPPRKLIGARAAGEQPVVAETQAPAASAVSRSPTSGAAGPPADGFEPAIFTKAMIKTHLLLVPDFSHFHTYLFVEQFASKGYRAELLSTVNKEVIDYGLKYTHNDACYPAVLIIGQFMHALHSGRYDLSRVALVLSQTGGGCRATNYIALLQKALRDAGMQQVPVIPFALSSSSGIRTSPGLQLNNRILIKMVMNIILGDVLQHCLLRTRPYEGDPGAANALYAQCMERCKVAARSGSYSSYKAAVRRCVQDFDALPVRDIVKPRVGIVGEILVKIHAGANNHLVDFLESEGAEAVCFDFLDFIYYGQFDNTTKHRELSGKFSQFLKSKLSIWLIRRIQKPARTALLKSHRFNPPQAIQDLARMTAPYASPAIQFGEGWLLTGEIVELLHLGVRNVLVLQPFGCLPNHITGRGMIKRIRRDFPDANIAAIDYDPGASEINQVNRIKLMLSIAFKQMKAASAPRRDIEELVPPQAPAQAPLASYSDPHPTPLQACATCAACEACADTIEPPAPEGEEGKPSQADPEVAQELAIIGDA